MRISKDLVAITVLTVILCVLSITNIYVARTASENQLDRERFAPYMKCLIVPDEALYAELGRQKYVEHCEKELGD